MHAFSGAMAEAKPAKLEMSHEKQEPTSSQRMFMYCLISGHSLCIYTIRAFVVSHHAAPGRAPAGRPVMVRRLRL